MRKIVYALILDEKGEIVLVESGGYWRMPGGIVFRGEHVLVGLRRIVRTVLATRIESIEFLRIYENKSKNENTYYYKIEVADGTFANSHLRKKLEYFDIKYLPRATTIEHKKRLKSFFREKE